MEQPVPSEDETLVHIAILLILTQQVEHVTAHLIGIAYSRGKPSWEEIEKLSGKTLGNLAAELKRRVDLHPTFEGLFNHFVQGRNILAHRLIHEPWFDTHSEAGRAALWEKFLTPYSKLLYEVHRVVLAALFKHSEDSDMPKSKSLEQLRDTGFLDYIKEYYPRSSTAFRGKKSSGG